MKKIPYAIGIKCINCGKTIGCLLYNQTIEKFITTFVTNTVFQNVSLSGIIQLKNSILIFSFTVLLAYLMDHGITILYIHGWMVSYLNIMLQLPDNIDIISCVQLRPMKDSTRLNIMMQLVVVADHCHITQQNTR